MIRCVPDRAEAQPGAEVVSIIRIRPRRGRVVDIPVRHGLCRLGRDRLESEIRDQSEAAPDARVELIPGWLS